MPVNLTPLLNILATFNTDLKYSRIYNLTGSSAALLFALFDEPFLAVELTDELAEELYKDIIFFREILKKEQILFLPEINGPALSGERAKLVYSLNENVSLVCSFKNLETIIWSREEINKKVISIKKGIEISRTEIEERLKEIGYKNVSLVSEKGEYSRRGWLFDIFPSTSDTPIRIEFFGDEIDNIKIFDVDTQKSTEDLTQLLIFPAEDPLSGSTIFELMDHAKYIFSDSIRERAGLRRDIIFFSKYSIKGPGYDAGVLPIKGLGILPEERKKLGELPQRIKHLQRDNRIVIVSSSEGQAERLKSILSDGNVVAPGIASTDILDYKG